MVDVAGSNRRSPIARVSIVTVCLNARDTIAMTMDSVLEQTFPSIEHVIIDGGSTDGTIEIVRERAPAYFVSERDDGLYHAMEKGAHAATGDVVFFLNSGDVFHDKNVVKDVVDCFNRSGVDAVFGNLLPRYLNIGDQHDHQAFRDGQLIDLSYFNNRRLFFDESIHHQTIFYRREIFDRCGYLCAEPEATGEYHLHMCAFIRHGLIARHIPRTICRFALGGKSTSNFAEEWARFSRARDILRRTFFPNGKRVPINSAYEYLERSPPLPMRLRIWLRRSPLHPHLSRLKHYWQRTGGRLRIG